jgi:hypothetical protein
MLRNLNDTAKTSWMKGLFNMKKKVTEETRIGIEIIEDSRDYAIDNIEDAIVFIDTIIIQAKDKFKDPFCTIAGSVITWKEIKNNLIESKKNIRATASDLIKDFKNPGGAEVKYE